MTDPRACSEPGCELAGEHKFGRGLYCLEHFVKRIAHNTERRRDQAAGQFEKRARGLAVLADRARDVDAAKALYRKSLAALARDEGLLE